MNPPTNAQSLRSDVILDCGKISGLENGEVFGPLRCDNPWRLREVLMYVAKTHPGLFIECFAGAAGTTLTLLQNNIVQRGILVVGDEFLETFWREALSSDRLIEKVCAFEPKSGSVEDVLSHPARDPALWTLIKSQCSWQGRLDPKAFLEWGAENNAEQFWNRNLWRILTSLSSVRSVSDRLEVILGRDAEVLTSYPEAVALIQDPFDPHDNWNKALRENWNSESHQEKLLRVLSQRKGRWMLLDSKADWREKYERSQIGTTWLTGGKWSGGPGGELIGIPVLVSDQQFAAVQNERFYEEEKRQRHLLNEFLRKSRGDGSS